MSYDAVILDFDGVLLTAGNDYRALIEEMAETALDTYLDPTHDSYPAWRDALITQDIDALESLGAADDVDHHAVWRDRERIGTRLQREQVERGERSLYDDVAALEEVSQSCALGLASNNGHGFIDYMVSHEDVFPGGTLSDLFAAYYGIQPDLTDASRRKPDPHYVDRVITELDAAHPLYVGDSDVDLLAAAAAGVDSAFIWRDHRRDENGNRTYDLPVEPTHHIESLHDLLDLM